MAGSACCCALPRPAVDAEASVEVEVALQLDSEAALRYADARVGQRRAMRLHADGSLQGFMLAGDAAAQGWVLDLLQQSLPAAAMGRALLAARRTPPGAVPVRSPQVCACHNVSRAAIVATLAQCSGDADERLRALQSRLRCGTECGSCLPALKTLVREAVQGQPQLA